MRITLVSHAQTEDDFLRRVLGGKNVMLNDTGRRQCQMLSMKIKNNNYDYCYMSPLVRDVETAMILIGDRVEMIPDSRLVERNTGEFEGDTLDNYNLYKYWDYTLDKDDFGVEKVSNVIDRISSFYSYIKGKYPVETKILIVLDKSTYRAFRVLLNKIELKGNLFDGMIDNCCIENFEI